MSKNQYHFVTVCKTTYEHHTGMETSQVISNDLRLELSGNLDRSVYIDGKGLPRKDALKPISANLLLGLITNIRMGAEKGWWKESEHMQWVINHLQEAYVTQASIGESTMEI